MRGTSRPVTERVAISQSTRATAVCLKHRRHFEPGIALVAPHDDEMPKHIVVHTYMPEFEQGARGVP